MRCLRWALSFVLIFAILACSITVLTGALEEGEIAPPAELQAADEAAGSDSASSIDTSDPDTYIVRGDNTDLAAVGADYKPRLTAPSKKNGYYYSDKNVFYRYGWGMPNCTAYAWGRAYEILGSEPKLSVYSAYLWYDYNKENKIYSYGKTPKLGAIACWVYASGYSGHVAVVEKIEGNTVTYSNSAWGGSEFYTTTAPKDDPSDGNDYWIFQGYIYIGNYTSKEQTTSAEDTPTGDVYRITSDTGVNLRKTAGTSGVVIGAIGCGQDVTVTKTAKKNGYNWGYTTYNGKSGWFVTDFAKLIYTKTNETAKTDTAKTETAQTDTAKTETTKTAAKTKSATRTLKMGDINNDGRVSIMDATLMQRVLAELHTPSEYMLTVGDYNGDSVFSIFDAGSIQTDLVNEVIK